MSHEIRTPMNGVLGMLHMLGKTELGSTQQRLVDTATGSGKVLLSVINDILDFSKLEADKLELESIPFELENLLGQSIALLAKGAQEKEIELLYSLYSLYSGLPDKILGDPTWLRQVLTNLIGNAIKFTDEGEVELYAKAVAGNSIRFGVRDTGIGMSQAQQQGLFKAFSQVDSSHTRKYGGTGLGLAISQKLISVMGGEISVVSSPMLGSNFSFELPLEWVDGSVSKPYLSDMLAKQRILIVDDNASMRHLLAENLKRWQVKSVGMAEEGDDALTQLRSAAAADEAYDIAILDKKMPGMDGLELAHIIRADAALSDMKLVMLSGMEHHVLPGIDLVDGLQRMCGSWTAYKMILLGFRDAHADAAEALDEYIRQGEWEQAKSLAHTIKGSGGNISAKKLYEIAASVEQSCRAEDAGAAIAEIDALKACFNEVIIGLADLESLEIKDED